MSEPSVTNPEIDQSQKLRQNFLKTSSLVIGVFTFLSLISSLTGATEAILLVNQVGLLVVCVAAYMLGRSGYNTLGGLLLSLGLIASISFTAPPPQLLQTTLGAAYVIPILVAGMVAGAASALAVSGISMVLLVVMALITPKADLAEGVMVGPLPLPTLTTIFIIGVIGGLSWVIFRSQRRLLDQALLQTNQALAAQNQIAEREQALIQVNSKLQSANDQQTEMLSTIRALETPTIPLLDGVLVVPLVGNLDTARMEHLTQSVLHSIHSTKTHTLILDVTGIPVIDTGVAQRLQELALMIQLLGASVMITGFRVDSALTVTSLGLEFKNIQTLAHLQDGITRILQARN